LKQWKQREPAIPYNEKDTIIEKLAKINGITDLKRFLNPSVEDTHHYSLLNNVEDAVNLIVKHMKLRSKIVIFGDPDYDGAATTGLLARYLWKFTDNVHIIHMQRSDGHSLRLVENFIPDDTNLLIIVDSSTNDIEACQRVSEKGIPILIIDHHEFEGEENPYALIVNPRMPDCIYPNKNMSGALTTLKVLMGVDDMMDTNYHEELIDLAGFSLLADAMSALEPENRYYVNYALDNVTNLGMKVLLDKLGVNPKKLNSTTFLYSISPCVTAITRMDKLELAIQLFISDDILECAEIADQMIKANESRKKMQRDAIELVKPQIDENDKIIVIVEPSIGKGFNGIVAARIAESYQRPVIVLGHKNEEDKQYSGSFRSYGEFPVRSFLKQVKHANYSAGHEGAGGTACWKNKLEEFKKEINQKLKDHVFESYVEYDLEIDSAEVNEQLINQIEKFFKVSGQGIKPALFKIKDLLPIDKKVIGKGDTLKIPLVAASDTWFINEEDCQYLNNRFEAMKFKTDQEFIEKFPIKKEIEIIGTLSVNEFTNFRGKTTKTNQIIISEYRVV
jgi:Single-stranded DNA-specific exonuclease